MKKGSALNPDTWSSIVRKRSHWKPSSGIVYVQITIVGRSSIVNDHFGSLRRTWLGEKLEGRGRLRAQSQHTATRNTNARLDRTKDGARALTTCHVLSLSYLQSGDDWSTFKFVVL
jgi:hypothetical protein